MASTLILIGVSSLAASLLTFFSGFGLGTLLSPIFMLFFPADVAIALTGVVHFSNNLFKLTLTGRHADKGILLRFGIPAFLAAALGAWVLLYLSDIPPLFHLEFFGATHAVTPVKFTVGVLLLFFAAMEVVPTLTRLSFGRDRLILGGLLSGFFGGLSGNQGALRSAFLIKAGLTKEAYIGTGVVVACFVDVTRIGVYSTHLFDSGLHEQLPLIVTATLSAMAGALIGNRLFRKMTLGWIKHIVTFLLVAIALGLITGML